MFLPAIFSLMGYEITKQEAALFREYQPFGFILFARNIDTPKQLSELTKSLKGLIPNACIMIDQEGGRVQRMKQPHWPAYPCMQNCSTPADVMDVITRLSSDLTEVGIDTNCAPVLDVLQDDTDASIGDRAFSSDPQEVTKLGGIACETFMKSGIKPIIKHLPGHGRAIVDSHEDLPIIDASLDTLKKIDFYPFIEILKQPYGANLWGMVGHCIYSAIDLAYPASLSKKIISDVIREEIGFKGLLFSDDLSMGALDKYGDVATRAKLCLEAGCDIALYCHGDLEEMRAIADKIS